MNINEVKKGQFVALNIPAGRPVKTLDGNLHECGQVYKVLGTHGTCVRLSRETDHAKLIIEPGAVLFLPKSNKAEAKLIDEVNGVIHSRNLYVETPNGNRRVYNAHMSYAGPVVQDLHNGVNYDLFQNKFADGYGAPVAFRPSVSKA